MDKLTELENRLQILEARGHVSQVGADARYHATHYTGYSGATPNLWFQIAELTITGQYQGGQMWFSMSAQNGVNERICTTEFIVSVKQQNTMAGSPTVDLSLISVKGENRLFIRVIVTQDNGTAKVFKIYAMQPYQWNSLWFRVIHQGMNTGAGIASMIIIDNASGIASGSLPAGTQYNLDFVQSNEFMVSGNTYLTANGWAARVQLRTDYHKFFTRFVIHGYVANTNDVNNYWAISLIGGERTLTNWAYVQSFYSNGQSPNAYWLLENTGDLSNPVVGYDECFVVDCGKGGNPGGLTLFWAVYYRLIVP